jgi:hypothetical protein
MVFFLLFVNSFVKINFNKIYYKTSLINSNYNNNININVNNLIVNQDIYIFGLEDNIEKDKFYFIIGENNKQLYFLMKKLIKFKYFGIHVDSNIYKKKDLLDIKKNYIQNDKNVSMPFGNNFWIFNGSNYVGGLFEVYSEFYSLK